MKINSTPEEVSAYFASVDAAIWKLEATTQRLVEDRALLGGKDWDGHFVGRVDEALTALQAVSEALIDAKGRLLRILPAE
jgi:hypothetical protein